MRSIASPWRLTGAAAPLHPRTLSSFTPALVAKSEVWLMVATLVGGALAAGGANATNMVVDRDIDRDVADGLVKSVVFGPADPRDVVSPGRAGIELSYDLAITHAVRLNARYRNLLSACLRRSPSCIHRSRWPCCP